MPRPKKYTCKECDKAFTTTAKLERHERIHTGKKPYKCHLCHRQFTQEGHLTVHLRTHTGEKPYKCDHCGREFAQSGVFYRHKRTHTGEKPYVCTVCDERFNLMISLKKHKCGVKTRFDCPFCPPKWFKLKRTLLKHLQEDHPDCSKELQLSLSTQEPPGASFNAPPPPEVSIAMQQTPNGKRISSVTHESRSTETGTVTRATQISDDTGESVVLIETTIAALAAAAEEAVAAITPTGPSTSTSNVQAFPVGVVALSQSSGEDSGVFPQNPLDFGDLMAAWGEDDLAPPDNTSVVE
ncbi:C2H2-type zinc finger protein [Candidatus Sororendozoicomonas aggregata]|uniref:C2H2-type zinc finger protein n=1 Tax=Candidatus Sororendozoicomonas aggregata TaxID=3073239 RepID=UPI002ED26E79